MATEENYQGRWSRRREVSTTALADTESHVMNEHDAHTILTHQMLTEFRLEQLLNDAESVVTIDKVKALVFEADNEDFRTYLAAMLSAIDSDVDDVEQAALQVIQDAWNYFPHRSLNGRCPAEVMAAGGML